MNLLGIECCDKSEIATQCYSQDNNTGRFILAKVKQSFIPSLLTNNLLDYYLFLKSHVSLTLFNRSSKDVEMKEKTPLKSKLQSTECDSPPVKKARQQKAQRILDDSSDEENNATVKKKSSSVQQNGHIEEKKQGTEEQKRSNVSKNGEVEDQKEKGRLIEVTSPQNETTLVPKRITGTLINPLQSWCYSII